MRSLLGLLIFTVFAVARYGDQVRIDWCGCQVVLGQHVAKVEKVHFGQGLVGQGVDLILLLLNVALSLLQRLQTDLDFPHCKKKREENWK